MITHDPSAPSSERGTVLIVDDNPRNLQLLAEMLSDGGYTVRPASSGRRALRSAQAEPPDIVLLDINMPEMDGYAVCRQLKADPANRDLPVIFISALDEVADKVRAFAEGGVDYITKPFRIEEVQARIEAHLTIRRMRRTLEAQNERLHILARFPDENPNPVLRVDPTGTILYQNRAAADLLTRWPDQHGDSIPDYLRASVTECLDDGDCTSVEAAVGPRAYQFLLVPIPRTDSLYIYGQDITDRRRYEEQLHLAASVFDNAIEGIMITDPAGVIQRVNPGFTAITGYSSDEAVGRTPRLIKSNRHGREFYKTMWRSLIVDGQWQGEIWNRRKSGEAYPEWLSVTAIRDHADTTTHYVAVFRDISDEKRSEARLKHQAYHDPLTGLPNRQLFNDRLDQALARARRNKTPVAVLFLDLDKFKTINDSLGHKVGDQLLQEVATRIKGCVRDEDTVARLGGDEFILILQNSRRGENDAEEVARRIIAALAEPVFLEGHEVFTSPSIGITSYPEDGRDVDTLVKNADMAMYRAKGQGRATYELYTRQMDQGMLAQITLESSLRRALDRDQIRVHHQPKVDLATGRIIGTEALARWRRGDGDWVSPETFIPVAEDTRFILPLGEYILRTACRQSLEWRGSDGIPLPVAVNLSGLQLQDARLFDRVRAALSETGLSPDRLTLEITENIVMTDVERAIERMGRLSDLGIRISMDDFGTGYSSLNYLKQFPLDELKIDKSFVQDIPHHADDMAIVRAILSMAESLGLRVVAEGVETEAQARFLLDHGCREAQGYRYGRAVPPDDLARQLAGESLRDQ